LGRGGGEEKKKKEKVMKGMKNNRHGRVGEGEPNGQASQRVLQMNAFGYGYT